MPSSPRATGAHLSDLTAAAQRRTIGRAAGSCIALGSIVALLCILFRDRPVPPDFVVQAGIATIFGLACCVFPWDRHSPSWLHAIPIFATVNTALAIRAAHLYGSVPTDYYVFVGLFAGYAFSSRRAIAGHVLLASIALALPLLYAPRDATLGESAAVGIALLCVVTGIVTLLREGLQARQHELEELAIRDPLTAVGNYRLLTERLSYEIARHRRSGESLTVMLLDLDGFKEINDTHGHLAGDRVLIEVARALRSCVRSQDTVARQGGDEFSILAPETNSEQAACLASRVQTAVNAAMAGSLTTSIGWVTFPSHADEMLSLLALADAELRRAKHEREPQGRRRLASVSAG
jgi:diguanylate cyclase (GGDEF)-like protein